MNTIIVDYEKVRPYFNDGTVREFIFDNFKFYVNNLDKTQLRYKINLEDGLIKGKAIRVDDNGNEITLSWVLSDGKYKNSYVKASCLINGVPAEKEYNEVVFNEVRHLTGLLDGIMTMPRKREVRKRIQQGNRERDKSKNYYCKSKTVFLLDDIVEYIYENKQNHSTNIIECPCWSVRGHYRHYKSGKVVFVKEYKKGKERANAEPKDKTYTV